MCEYCAYLYAYINTHVYIFKGKKIIWQQNNNATYQNY